MEVTLSQSWTRHFLNIWTWLILYILATGVISHICTFEFDINFESRHKKMRGLSGTVFPPSFFRLTHGSPMVTYQTCHILLLNVRLLGPIFWRWFGAFCLERIPSNQPRLLNSSIGFSSMLAWECWILSSPWVKEGWSLSDAGWTTFWEFGDDMKSKSEYLGRTTCFQVPVVRQEQVVSNPLTVSRQPFHRGHLCHHHYHCRRH